MISFEWGRSPSGRAFAALPLSQGLNPSWDYHPNAVGEVITFRWLPRPFAFAPKVRTHVRRFYCADAAYSAFRLEVMSFAP